MTTPRAFAVWTAAVLVAAGAIALAFASDHEDHPVRTAALAGAVGLAFVAAGLHASARRPENRTGLLMMLVGFTWFLGALGEANASIPFTAGIAAQNLVFVPFAWLLLAFPGGRLRGGFDQAIVAAVLVLAAPLQIAAMLVTEPSSAGCEGCPANAILTWDSETLSESLLVVGDVLGLVILLAIAGRLAGRFRRATPATRRTLVPVYAAAAAALAVLAASVVVDAAGEVPEELFSWLSLLSLLAVPVAFGFGLLRGRLAVADVSRVLVETPTPTLASAQEAIRLAIHDPDAELALWQAETEGYADVDGRPLELPEGGGPRIATPIEYRGRRVGALVHDVSVLEQRALLRAVVASSAVGIEKDRILHELERERDFIRTVVNSAPTFFCVVDLEGRIVRYNDPLARATGRVDDERVRGRPFWEVFLPPEEVERARRNFALLVAGRPSAEREYELLCSGGERLLVSWTGTQLQDEMGRDRLLFSGLDVTELRRQQEELRASRARLVEAGDAERRRLERNLHDGAQQRLVSLSVGLRLARLTLRRDPEQADRMLGAAAGELARALEELRELARGIHPAVLTERGLAPALESLASRSPVPVRIDVAAERLPNPVEAAAYYVVSEALANVAKYASASGVAVTVARTDGSAFVEVADDGVGGADPARGTGLRGLADRVEALDGRLRVESRDGAGTRIVAEIPCTQP